MVKNFERCVGNVGSPRPPVPAREAGAVWHLEPHICRACFSRLVSCDAAADGRLYHCTNCGMEAVGVDAGALCCCGTKIRRPTKGSKSGHTLVDAGVRCIVNPAPTPDFPSVIIAAEVET